MLLGPYGMPIEGLPWSLGGVDGEAASYVLALPHSSSLFPLHHIQCVIHIVQAPIQMRRILPWLDMGGLSKDFMIWPNNFAILCFHWCQWNFADLHELRIWPLTFLLCRVRDIKRFKTLQTAQQFEPKLIIFTQGSATCDFKWLKWRHPGNQYVQWQSHFEWHCNK